MSNKAKREEVENQKPGEYTKSQTVLDAEKALSDYESTKPGAYQSSYTAQMDALLNKITGRGDFSYDLEADPLYRQYSRQYTRQGEQAAQNVAANAAALTGGYASSYAATAASQANQQYLAKLNDVIPDLYDAALSRYKLEGNTLAQQAEALKTADDTAYSRWSDSYDNWADYLAHLTDSADTAYKKDYNQYTDSYDAWENWRDYFAKLSQQDEENELAKTKLAQQQSQWQAEHDFAVQKWQQEQEAAQQAAATAAAAAAAATASKASRSTSGSSSAGKTSGKTSSATSGAKINIGNTATKPINKAPTIQVQQGEEALAAARGSGAPASVVGNLLLAAGYGAAAVQYALSRL